MVTCYDCRGNGYQLFLGNESHCRPCDGSGKLQSCEAFALSPTAVVSFRNQKCYKCGVRQNDHDVVEVSA